MNRPVKLPYTMVFDEGVWYAGTELRGLRVVGEGPTPAAAKDDLEETVLAVLRKRRSSNQNIELTVR
ncbi:hypothetical protein O4J56_15500 [Nocardiopsis sp. RSe5-2]|uniref:HicB family protein n=1 Tax=Nocardiopsis endophytica TaxID=3018445 RepID=A0ABT4U528_9ACTN|nr:hypothetical protein [Nocardiopsis endophytica]MDA2812048.1 hypothetical protein [Nocardiopsis endophytica]